MPTYHESPDDYKVGEEVSILDKLCHEADWLLESDAADHVDHVWVVSLCDQLHGVNLGEKVTLFTPHGCF